MRLAFVGDIMLGDHPVCFGHGVRSQALRHGLDELLAQAKPLLKQHDAVVGNLETVLSSSGERPRTLQSLEFRGHPCFAAQLRGAGFTALTLANNHILEHGVDAFAETADVLDREGLQVLGLKGGDRGIDPVLLRGSTNVVMLACSLRPEVYAASNNSYSQPDPAALISEVASQVRGGRVVVVTLHWGREYQNFPSPDQKSLAHALIDAGATLIVGHHPHVVQPVETYGNGLIAYSLGNFLFDSWLLDCKKSKVLSVELENGKIKHWQIHAFRQNDQHAIVRPEAGTGESDLSEFVTLCEQWKIATPSSLPNESTYQANADKAERLYSLSSYAYFARNLFRYQPWVIEQSIKRALLRKLPRWRS